MRLRSEKLDEFLEKYTKFRPAEVGREAAMLDEALGTTRRERPATPTPGGFTPEEMARRRSAERVGRPGRTTEERPEHERDRERERARERRREH